MKSLRPTDAGCGGDRLKWPGHTCLLLMFWLLQAPPIARRMCTLPAWPDDYSTGPLPGAAAAFTDGVAKAQPKGAHSSLLSDEVGRGPNAGFFWGWRFQQYSRGPKFELYGWSLPVAKACGNAMKIVIWPVLILPLSYVFTTSLRRAPPELCCNRSSVPQPGNRA